MKKLIYVPLAVVIGLIDGVLSSTFSVAGLGFSLTISAVVAAFSAGNYSVAVFLVVSCSIIKHLLCGAHLGWFELFGSAAITLAGVARYFAGVSEKWIEWITGLILLFSLYFFEFLVQRGFALKELELLRGVGVWSFIVWALTNFFAVVLLSYLFRFLFKWVTDEN